MLFNEKETNNKISTNSLVANAAAISVGAIVFATGREGVKELQGVGGNIYDKINPPACYGYERETMFTHKKKVTWYSSVTDKKIQQPTNIVSFRKEV